MKCFFRLFFQEEVLWIAFVAVLQWIISITSVDYQHRICGLTEPLLWIQLVAEGSASSWRTFGVAMAKVRRVNVEGSAFQLNQRKSSVQSLDCVCTSEAFGGNLFTFLSQQA